MLVTLDVLKSKEAYGDGIKYFKSLEKQEWEVIELMERCFKDYKNDYAGWLFKCVETVEELKQIVKLYIKKGEHLGFAFEYCNKAFENDLELFKKAVEYYIKKGGSLCDAFEYCNKAFKNDPALHKKALEYQKRFS